MTMINNDDSKECIYNINCLIFLKFYLFLILKDQAAIVQSNTNNLQAQITALNGRMNDAGVSGTNGINAAMGLDTIISIFKKFVEVQNIFYITAHLYSLLLPTWRHKNNYNKECIF
jgi:hypothetical protein